ncbi:hypothetical protein SAMN05444380_11970 [Thermophagus xiamenensis]|uniref:Uncharacterized protein n=1 Tax=Thermophagus xiamenensis TaxID=385682 RepID=A0A1I2DPL1_9BACT|nr:hypothetical protein SAMN05444380_11970 [Thermophagus xiamenensis]
MTNHFFCLLPVHFCPGLFIHVLLWQNAAMLVSSVILLKLLVGWNSHDLKFIHVLVVTSFLGHARFIRINIT